MTCNNRKALVKVVANSPVHCTTQFDGTTLLFHFNMDGKLTTCHISIWYLELCERDSIFLTCVLWLLSSRAEAEETHETGPCSISLCRITLLSAFEVNGKKRRRRSYFQLARFPFCTSSCLQMKITPSFPAALCRCTLRHRKHLCQGRYAATINHKFIVLMI